MKRLVKYFLQGLLAVAPLALTAWIIIWLFKVADGILGDPLQKLFGNYIPGKYIPGLGLLIMVILITLIGILASALVSKAVMQWIENLMGRIPLVKSIYSTVKDVVHSLLGEKKSFSQVALVKIPDSNMKIVGFVTLPKVISFPELEEDHIAVYIPQSFQVAGFTVLVPKDDVIFVNMTPDEALKFVVSAGITGNRKKESRISKGVES